MYQKVKLLSSVMIIVLILSLLSTGCVTKVKDPDKQGEINNYTEVTYWIIDWGGKYTNITKKVIDEYNQSQNEIRVKMTAVTPTQGKMTPYDNKLFPAIAGGTPPDIVMVAGVPRAVEGEIIQDITDLVEKDKGFMDKFYPYKVGQCEYKGKYYAIPYGANFAGVMLYNKTMFKKEGLDPNTPPKTIEQLDRAAERLYKTDDTGDYTQVGFYPWEWLMAESQSLVAPFGGGWIDEEGNLTPDNPRNLTALEWALSYAKKYGYAKVNSSLQRLSKNPGGPFANGVLGMMYAYDGQIQILVAEEVSFEWDLDVALFPTVSEDIQPGWGGGWLLAMPVGAKNREAAYEFIKYYCGDATQAKLLKNYEIIGFSANKSANEANKDIMPRQLQFFMDYIFPQLHTKLNVDPFGLVIDTEYQNMCRELVQNVVQEKVEPNAGIADLKRKMDARRDLKENE